MSLRRNKKRKKIKYKRITFKLSEKQYRSFTNYTKARRTTHIKLIKKILKPFITGYEASIPDDIPAAANQLEIFDEE